MKSLLSINKSELKYNNISDIINERFNTIIGKCPLCSYNYDGSIKSNNISNNCMTTNFINIKMLKFLFIVFDLEDENNMSQDLNNLKSAQNDIIKLLKPNNKILNKDYNLIGLIHYPYLNHYTSSLLNFNHDIMDLKEYSLYYNDCNLSELVKKIKIDNKDNIIQYLSQ